MQPRENNNELCSLQISEISESNDAKENRNKYLKYFNREAKV